jgi:hypothetical protein
LTSRYFRLPEDVKLQVRVLTRDQDDWPTEEPSPAVKTYNFETVRGTKALLDDYATAKGTVSLSTADVHWWIFDDPRQASGGKQVPGPELYRKEKANCRHLT